MKHYEYLNLCIHKAIDYNDNYGKVEDDTKSKTSDSFDEIVKVVIEKIQQMYGPSRADRCIEKPHCCGVCGGNHPTRKCPPMRTKGGVRQNPHMAY